MPLPRRSLPSIPSLRALEALARAGRQWYERITTTSVAAAQVAVLSGMRAGYDAMLRFFSPDNIERRNGGAQGGVFSSKGARNWENFVDMYRQLVSDPETCYRRLFGDEFASTYESQLSELKNARSFGKG